MPVYEYRCEECGEVREATGKIATRNEPIVRVCIERPLSVLEIAAGITDADRKQCEFKRILSPTATTFRFNDFPGY